VLSFVNRHIPTGTFIHTSLLAIGMPYHPIPPHIKLCD